MELHPQRQVKKKKRTMNNKDYALMYKIKHIY